RQAAKGTQVRCAVVVSASDFGGSACRKQAEKRFRRECIVANGRRFRHAALIQSSSLSEFVDARARLYLPTFGLSRFASAISASAPALSPIRCLSIPLYKKKSASFGLRRIASVKSAMARSYFSLFSYARARL